MPDSQTATVPPSKHLAFQFEDLEQQHTTSTFGMWIFLATEVLFFGALFTGYLVYGFIRPRLSRKMVHDIEEEEEDEEERSSG